MHQISGVNENVSPINIDLIHKNNATNLPRLFTIRPIVTKVRRTQQDDSSTYIDWLEKLILKSVR